MSSSSVTEATKPSDLVATWCGVEKSVVRGGEGGTPWTSGFHHEDWTRLVVTSGGHGIESVKFFPVNSNEHEERRLGSHLLLDMKKHHEEYVVSVEGWYDSSNIIKGLVVKTNKDSFDHPVGKEFHDGDTNFTIQAQGKKIIGFHGYSSGKDLNSIGVYFVPIESTFPLPPEIKLQGYGGDGGKSWDDALFPGVRKVSVGQTDIGIAALKFMYANGVETEHGEPTAMGYEEFELDYPREYITAVDGTYDKVLGSTVEVLTMLRFTTNKRTSDPFGLEAGTAFLHKEDDYKILGFHGMADDLQFHKFGVYALPITN